MYLVQEPTTMETLSASLYMSGLNWFSQSTEWSREENKKFERALAIFDEWEPNRWLKVAAMIPGKTVDDVKKQYKELEEDVSDIEAGKVPIPGYHPSSSNFTVLDLVDDATDFSFCRKRPFNARTADQQRKKGVPWTEEEHRRFLLGLLKHGKGDWRNISRNFVVSKTPTQVASHAQKYFIRQQLSGVKDKRRPSIHDITTINLTRNNSFHPSETDHRDSSIDQQDPAGNASQVLLEMNDQLMNGSITLFDSTHGDLFVSSPNYGTRLGSQKNLYAFDMPSTRHQIHG